MWRSLFLALGFTICLLGVEAMALDKAVLKVPIKASASENSATYGRSAEDNPGIKEIVPARWAPWSLVSAGAVVMLYSFTIPKRIRD